MLPIGHVAGGFLAGKLASIWIPALNQPKYLALSAFFGFFPDLDVFIAFAKAKKWTFDDKVNHRNFPTHTPLLYLAIFLIWFWLHPPSRLIAITFLAGTLSHFILDMVGSDGIAWLSPFSAKIFRLNQDPKIPSPNLDFMSFWKDFIKRYIKLSTFKMELGIIMIGILTLILSK